MVKILMAVVGLAATFSTAQASVYVSRVEADSVSVSGLDYGINAKLGRAWVIVNYLYSCKAAEECTNDTVPTPSLVKGLYYDNATRQVVYAEKGEKPVVCARLVAHQFLFVKWETVDATGNCGYGVTPSVSVKDDGYETKQVEYLNVYFGRTR